MEEINKECITFYLFLFLDSVLNMQDSILPICTSRICRVYIFFKIKQPLIPPLPPPPTQHVLYVPVIRNYNISGQMHVLCIRNFVTYAELMQTGKWSLLKIRGLWAMGFSDISGHHSIFRSVSYCQCQSLFTNYWWWEIMSKLTLQCLSQ